MDAQARRLTGAQVVIRTLFRTLDMFPYFYFVGGLVSLCSRHFQRLGDHVAGTVVIRTQRISPPALQDLPAIKFNTLRAHPRTEAHLHKEISPKEAEVILQALIRRDELDPESRLRVYRELASGIRKKLRLPADV